MSAKTVIEQMGTAARVNRLRAADYFLNHHEEIQALLKLTFNPEYAYHHKAAWVVEFVALRQLDFIFKHLDFFINSLALLKKDSAVRPIAKTTHLIVQKYFSKKQPDAGFQLNDKQVQLIITAAFDWLIGDYRVASKVHAMQIIFELGQLPATEDWVIPELKSILSENISKQTAGYRSRAERILNKLDKD